MRASFSVLTRSRPRTVIYSVAAASLVGATLFALFICLRGGAVPNALVNSPVTAWIAARAGARVSLGSLRLGCFRPGCIAELDAVGFDLELDTPEPLRVHVDDVHWYSGGPLTARAMRVRAGNRPDLLTIDSVEASVDGRLAARGVQIVPRPESALARIDAIDVVNSGRTVTASRIRIPFSSSSAMLVNAVTAGPLTPPDAEGWFRVDDTRVSGVRLQLADRSNTADACADLHAALAAGNELVSPLRPLPDFASHVADRVQRDLFYAAIAFAAIVFGLKLLSVWWMIRWPQRLAFAFASALLPFFLYYALHGALRAVPFLLIGAALIVAVAVLSRLLAYRAGPSWYNRWEPFAADVLSTVILLPLLAHGIVLALASKPPAGLQLARVAISNTTGEYQDAFTFTVPDVQIAGVRAPLPDAARDGAITVGVVRIPNIAATINEGGGQQGEVATIALSDTVVDDIKVDLDARSLDVKDILSHTRLRGTLKTSALERAIRNIDFLRGVALPIDGFDFAVDLKTVGPVTAPMADRRFDQSGHPTLDARVTASVQLADCSAKYAAVARIESQPLQAVMAADGDATHVFIRELATLPGSAVQVASGRGSVSLGNDTRSDLRLAGLSGSLGAARFAFDSVQMIAALPPLGRTGPQRIEVALGAADIRIPNGTNVHIARSSVEFRSPQARHIAFRSRAEDVRLETKGPREITADVPSIEAFVSGQITAELIPRLFTGDARIRVSDAASGPALLDTEAPLKVSADLWKGVFELPSQHAVFQESVSSGTTNRVPAQLAATARLLSISPSVGATLDGSVSISLLESSLGPARVALRDLALTTHARVDDAGPAVKLDFTTGWNDVQTPALAGAFCLEDISSLKLTADGSVSKLTLNADALSSALPSLQPCAAIPALPVSSFRVSGTWPVAAGAQLIQLENRSGTGLRVKDCECDFSRISIRKGRLDALKTTATLLGIQDLKGNGGFGIGSQLTFAADTAHVVSTLLDSGKTPLLDTTVDAAPGLLTFGSTHQHVGADRILSELKPVLAVFGLDPGSIDVRARLAALDGRIGFSNGNVDDIHTAVEIQNGPLASFEWSNTRINLSSDAAGGAGRLAVRLDVSRPSGPAGVRRLTVNADAPRLIVDALDRDGTRYSANATLQVAARGMLPAAGPLEPNRVTAKLADVLESLRQHADHAATALLPERRALEPLTRVDWKLQLGSMSPQQPFLEFGRDQLALRVGESSWDVSWESGGSTERSRVSGSASVLSNISVQGDSLLVDAAAPLRVQLAPAGALRTQLDVRLPVQIVFSEHLEQPRAPSDLLWDEDYYSTFWRDHPSVHSSLGIVPPLNSAELAAGPLAVLQLLAPSEAVHLALGYADTLQVHAPFAARVLFGGAAGIFQSNVKWSGRKALVDTRLNVAMKNIQAGAVDAAIEGANFPLVEDELDGRIAFRSDDLALDADSLALLLAGRPSEAQLDALGLSVKLTRSPEVANASGILQLSSDIQINVLNEALNRIIADIQLSNPPRLILYKDFTVDFQMEHGRIRTEPAVLALGGVQIFASKFVDVEGQVKVHLAPAGERVLLRDLIGMLRW